MQRSFFRDAESLAERKVWYLKFDPVVGDMTIERFDGVGTEQSKVAMSLLSFWETAQDSERDALEDFLRTTIFDV